MSVYHHALVLINSSLDGVPLLAHAAKMAEENAMRITIPISAPTTGRLIMSPTACWMMTFPGR